eukprot:284819437_1
MPFTFFRDSLRRLTKASCDMNQLYLVWTFIVFFVLDIACLTTYLQSGCSSMYCSAHYVHDTCISCRTSQSPALTAAISCRTTGRFALRMSARRLRAIRFGVCGSGPSSGTRQRPETGAAFTCNGANASAEFPVTCSQSLRLLSRLYAERKLYLVPARNEGKMTSRLQLDDSERNHNQEFHNLRQAIQQSTEGTHKHVLPPRHFSRGRTGSGNLIRHVVPSYSLNKTASAAASATCLMDCFRHNQEARALFCYAVSPSSKMCGWRV